MFARVTEFLQTFSEPAAGGDLEFKCRAQLVVGELTARKHQKTERNAVTDARAGRGRGDETGEVAMYRILEAVRCAVLSAMESNGAVPPYEPAPESSPETAIFFATGG